MGPQTLPCPLTTDDRLLELFGDQAAIALENANLNDMAHSELAERCRTEAHLRASEARFRLSP